MPSARYWREIPARYRLEASRCTKCEKVSYPARNLCPSCRGRESETVRLSRKGKVVTWTVVHAPPADLAMQAPYAMALIETPEGARLMLQVADCNPSVIKPNMEVALEFRRIRKEGHGGILCYGFKAVPG
jgi:uncharacterized OB-fold protein